MASASRDQRAGRRRRGEQERQRHRAEGERPIERMRRQRVGAAAQQDERDAEAFGDDQQDELRIDVGGLPDQLRMHAFDDDEIFELRQQAVHEHGKQHEHGQALGEVARGSRSAPPAVSAAGAFRSKLIRWRAVRPRPATAANRRARRPAWASASRAPRR